MAAGTRSAGAKASGLSLVCWWVGSFVLPVRLLAWLVRWFGVCFALEGGCFSGWLVCLFVCLFADWLIGLLAGASRF